MVRPKPSRESSVRVNSGIPGLDDVIEGGFEDSSIVLVCGDTGTGKTMFALQFLYNGAAKYGEPGVFITFEESKEMIYRHALNFGWDFEALEKKGLFRFIKYHPHQVLKIMQEGGGIIRDVIDEIGAKRLVVDSLTSYGLLFETRYKMRESFLELFDMLRDWGCTSVVTSEIMVTPQERVSAGIEFLTDAVIMLYHPRQDGARTRALEILKMRGTTYVDRIFPLLIEKGGISIYPQRKVFTKVYR